MVGIDSTVIRCDVLVAGGGIAGLMAAIAAAEQGAQVVLADKGDPRRSGSAAMGNDDLLCYIPEVHGSFERFFAEFTQSQFGAGGFYDQTIQKIFIRRTFAVVQDWQRWGINMKPFGDEWYFGGHAFPDRMKIFLKYDGRNQKAVLTAEALKRGVRLEKRTPITEFLVDEAGKVCGAIGLRLDSNPVEVVCFQAAAVISATGTTNRLYPSVSAGWPFNTAACPANAGGGRAAAYRAGAALVNLELPMTQAGPKYFSRGGKGSWIGVLTDSAGQPVGPFVTRPTKDLGDITADVWQGVFTEKYQNGTGPVYMNCTETAAEDKDFMTFALRCEGVDSLLEAMDRAGVDLARDMVEFYKYEPILIGRGIQIDSQGMTNVPGLFAAGDEVGNFQCGIAAAAVIGRLAGEQAALYAGGNPTNAQILAHPALLKAQGFYSQLLGTNSGASWQELNLAVQQLMQDYAGIAHVRSESMLRAGLKYLNDLEAQAREQVLCRNAHELMRALECFDLLLLGQLICHCALARQESRGMHRRADYTYTNPLLNNKVLTVQANSEGLPALAWRETF